MNNIEDTLQKEIICWFRNNFERHGKGIIVPVPNEAAYKRKDIEICNGAPDTIIILGPHTFFVENKAPKGNQSPDQVTFQNIVEKLGHDYYVCKSLDQFKFIIEGYLT